MINVKNLIKRYKIKYSKILFETNDFIELIFLCDMMHLDFKDALKNALIWSIRVKFSKKLTPKIICDWQEARINRIKKYKTQNKNPSIIDISLYEIYAESKELAEGYYNELIKQKTKKMINSESTNRICWTKKFLIEKHGEELGVLKYNNHLKFLKSISSTSIEHYINKGLSLEEAKIALHERQSTFSLEKCIKKHGEIDGTLIWQARQDKWQKSLNNKTKAEIDNINIKKGSNKNGIPLIGGISKKYFEINDPNHEKIGKLYYLKFYNNNIEFWKIGITTLSVESRFGSKKLCEKLHKLVYDVIFIESGTLYDCYILEQELLTKFKEYRIKINYNNFKSTECFNKDIMCNLKINLTKVKIEY